MHSGTLNCADVHKDVLAAVIRLNEAKALLAVEPFDSAGSHLDLVLGMKDPAGRGTRLVYLVR